MSLNGGIDNSYLELYDTAFQDVLRQQGSVLMMATAQREIQGDAQYVRQMDVGKAHWVTNHGGTTEFTDTKYDKRRLKPQEFQCALPLHKADLVRQGLPDVGQFARNMSNSCGEFLDQIIINGIGGDAFTEQDGIKPLPGAKEAITAGLTDNCTKEKCIGYYDKTQTIAWNDCTLGCDGNSIAVKAGLNASKIAKAVRMLRQKYNNGMHLVCVANSLAGSTARADNRIASTDFNTQPSLASGYLTPYGGCDAFLSSELVDGGKSAVKAAGTGAVTTNAPSGKDVKYAYIYAVENVILGCSMPLKLDSGENPERNFDLVLSYSGMYDCVRMFEESVVRIEILEDLTDVTADSFVQ